MSAVGGKADIEATKRNFDLRLAQKLRQLGDIRGDPARSDRMYAGCGLKPAAKRNRREILAPGDSLNGMLRRARQSPNMLPPKSGTVNLPRQWKPRFLFTVV
jgi:hypothetical protein